MIGSVAINIDGTIKTFTKGIPEKWNKVHYYHTLASDIHYEDGFRDFVTPTNLTGTQKLGALIFDAVNDVFTYAIVDKSAAELEQETANAKQMEAEKIKEAKIKAYVESVLTPTERLNYYPEWVAGTYAKDVRVTFKGKVFNNTTEGNVNAPDKGGWIEIK